MNSFPFQYLIAVDTPLPTGEGFLSYGSQQPLQIGEKVQIPIGRQDRIVQGYVLGPSSFTEQLKPVLEREEGSWFSAQQAALLRWVWQNWFTSSRSLLRCVIPSTAKRYRQWVRLRDSPQAWPALLAEQKKQKGYHELLSFLAERGGAAAWVDVPQKSLVGRAQKAGWLEVTRKWVEEPTPRMQTTAAFLCWQSWQDQLALLTQELKRMKTQGRQSLILIPEASLAPPLLETLARTVPVMRYTGETRAQERERVVQAAQLEENLVVLGTWSGLFLPFRSLGSIHVLHEESSAYTIEDPIQLQVISVARKLAEISGARLGLYSRSPSLESYLATNSGTHLLHRIAEPPIRHWVVERSGHLARPILSAINQRQKTKGRSLIFLNRRGTANTIICTDCGEYFPCPTCQVALTPHRQALFCHYCGYQSELPILCPRCNGAHLQTLGLGLERLEDELRQRWPQALVLRLDRETTGDRESVQAKLDEFRQNRKAIMIASSILRGHALPRVSLLVVINLDFALRLPSYRATERAYQMLGNLESLTEEVFLQFTSRSMSERLLETEDEFYAKELAMRKEGRFPPFGRLVRVLLVGKEEETVWRLAKQLRETLPPLTGGTISGPMEATNYLLRGSYRVEIILRFPNGPIADDLRSALAIYPPRGLQRLDVTMEPEELL
ncbi:MAG: primosomal protein N' [Coprothermobacterota bacterium]|nr:primosomal protein N' [Coprothermobacterota bacterium]